MQQKTHKVPVVTQVAAAVIGNALEWYDFLVFGFFAAIIARLFFPTDSQYASLLLTTATFGVGFFMRPVGGILIGLFADRMGRKPALQLVLVLMTIATAIMAFAPTYAAIGVAAPMLIVLARLMQGLATGGEFASATAFLIEAAPANRRGFYGSWQMFGQCLAVLTAAIVGATVTKGLSPEALDSWGWRVPFIIGLTIGPVALWIRRYMDETKAFEEIKRQPAEKRSISAMLSHHRREVLVLIGVVTAGTIAFYIILIYMPTFANVTLGIPLGNAFIAQGIAVAWMVVIIPFGGMLSDRIGRKPIMLAGLLYLLIVLYPLFSWLVANPSFGRLVMVQLLLCTGVAAYIAPESTAIAEQLPAGVRSTGIAISYNIAVMIFGGFAQFFVVWLGEVTGSPIAPAYYCIFGVVFGLVVTPFLRDHHRTGHLAAVDDAVRGGEATASGL